MNENVSINVHSIIISNQSINLATTNMLLLEKIVTFSVSHSRWISAICSLCLMYLVVFVRVDMSWRKIWPSAQVACFQRLCQSLLCEFSVTLLLTELLILTSHLKIGWEEICIVWCLYYLNLFLICWQYTAKYVIITNMLLNAKLGYACSQCLKDKI